MYKSIMKKVGIVFMIVSLLSLIGCGSLDQRQAKQIEKKLSEMYEGKTFEVLALGNRWGTLTNDTVTAHVREVERDVVFIIKMNTKGEIVANSYSGSAVNKHLEDLLNKNLKEEGITADSLLMGLGGRDVSDLNPDIHLDEYITKYSPEFFSDI
ncbi:hypothetical protein [Fervidibacillus halotolerans]|uniref:Uncharacterized protein n=1 Tax=Fervidibacillus halotolerans TaxID=2980027 RepID=A0A9E8RYP7_9BACI|nr:hypothetical protein [Fervidibacillus halotolerans]WAA12483.1 hypothetical protein OE105_13315 [Fervidibacillus halotolerans]